MRYDNGKSFHELIGGLLVPGEVSILGVTGQAGAGKSNHVAPLAMAEAEQQGYATAHLGLDAFFKLSSRARKAWLVEGEEIGGAEAEHRNNQISWWDFDRAEEALKRLAQGQPIHLTGVYNRADGGELTGEVNIDPTVTANGMLVVFDGVGVAHLNHMDKIMFVYADPDIRLERLRMRDKYRTGEEVQRRFALTQAFERWYFARCWDKIDLLVGNNIDNPRVLHPVDFETAFSDEVLLAHAEEQS